MAPRKTRSLSRKSLPSISESPGKENQFLRYVNDFQARVRRRESLRGIKQLKYKENDKIRECRRKVENKEINRNLKKMEVAGGIGEEEVKY
ncbi:hypothetical protein LSTR_LSTR002029 [Laodelphax striatellus]|uniref:Uncharacterized protein n=1 Tax=Laodelphax striatellus TaxID=195883 RepID=A0A482XIB5_LAOST|nr:hypothetical protein LSTR_LSTR002029 [Laodelphax striatellus]